jgi:membrane protease YdiL (CAAX protease family)
MFKPHDFGSLDADKLPSGFDAFIKSATPLIPIPILAIVLVALFFVFRNVWRELDEESHRERGAILAQGKMDKRPLVALAMCALVLTMQEYYGGRMFFEHTIRPMIVQYEINHPGSTKIFRYDELWGFGWWAGTRVFGYVLPLLLWKIFFPKDSILDFGLRTKGFIRHWWIIVVGLGIVIPSMLIVARQPDFGSYYPFYKTASRSWFDLLLWEGMYFAQFFALELFFRGFWLGSLRRSFGSGAIFVMAVPYCMIHYGKPYLEANGAIVAGIFLGSVAMMTRSVYHGFLLHITVAGLMDWLALNNRHALPTVFWPP